MEWWSIGVLEYWSDGSCKRRLNRIMGNRIIESGFSNFEFRFSNGRSGHFRKWSSGVVEWWSDGSGKRRLNRIMGNRIMESGFSRIWMAR